MSCCAKSSLCQQQFNFLLSNSSSDSQAQLIVRSVVKWRKFCRNKKIVTTVIYYARLTQCSEPFKKREKTIFFLKFISPDFWTDLNGCQQWLLFARQLTQQKCCLSSQGICYLIFIYLFTHVLLLIIILYFPFARKFFSYNGKD